MKRLFCLFFLYCFVAPISAQTIELTVSAEARADWPFVGQVTHGHDRLGLCTGTLIAPDKVLTAAHCVVNPESGKVAPFHRVRFRAGLHDGKELTSSFARSVAVHPGYLEVHKKAASQRLELFEYDIALITLKHPMPNVVHADVTERSNASGQVTVMGYQKGSNDTLIDYVGCSVTQQDTRFLGLSCAVKQGTSGGPVLSKTSSGWELIGVVVAATGRDATDVQGVAVRADMERLQDLFPTIFR